MLRWFILKKNSKAKKIISMDTGQDTKDTSRPVANIREERTNLYTRGVARAAYGSTTPYLRRYSSGERGTFLLSYLG